MPQIITIDGIRVPIGTHEGKSIIIGADHRGYSHKGRVVEEFNRRGYSYKDVGTFSPERCDYPTISDEIGKLVSEYTEYNAVGIGFCGSGIGILISASKHKGVYIARCLTPDEARTSRKHNNTNMLGIGADFVDLETTLAIIEAWLITPFYPRPGEEDAYLRRYIQTVQREAEVFDKAAGCLLTKHH